MIPPPQVLKQLSLVATLTRATVRAMHSDSNTRRKPPIRVRSAHRIDRACSLLQIHGLENGTEYYVRVSAYNGPGGENSSTNSTEGFTTYGLPEDASQFPIVTIEQARVVSFHNACTCTPTVARSVVLGIAVRYSARCVCARRMTRIESATLCNSCVQRLCSVVSCGLCPLNHRIKHSPSTLF